MAQINELTLMEWEPLPDTTLFEQFPGDPCNSFDDLLWDPNNLVGSNDVEISFDDNYDPIGDASFPYEFDLTSSDSLAIINDQNVYNSLPNSSVENCATLSPPSLINLRNTDAENTQVEELGDSANNVLVGGSYLDGPPSWSHWPSMAAPTTYPIDSDQYGALSMDSGGQRSLDSGCLELHSHGNNAMELDEYQEYTATSLAGFAAGHLGHSFSEFLESSFSNKRSLDSFLQNSQEFIADLDHFQRNGMNGQSTTQSIKRRRINKKKPIGNNPYGRTGTLTCETMRKRRQKCVYYAEWLPCEYCRCRPASSPCIKLLPPKTGSMRFNATKLILKALVLPWLLEIRTPFPFKLSPQKSLFITEAWIFAFLAAKLGFGDNLPEYYRLLWQSVNKQVSTLKMLKVSCFMSSWN